jgi:hypothetical protein
MSACIVAATLLSLKSSTRGDKPRLLRGDSRFQVSDADLLFLQLCVLFEEFVKQHHIHRIIAHG